VSPAAHTQVAPEPNICLTNACAPPSTAWKWAQHVNIESRHRGGLAGAVQALEDVEAVLWRRRCLFPARLAHRQGSQASARGCGAPRLGFALGCRRAAGAAATEVRSQVVHSAERHYHQATRACVRSTLHAWKRLTCTVTDPAVAAAAPAPDTSYMNMQHALLNVMHGTARPSSIA